MKELFYNIWASYLKRLAGILKGMQQKRFSQDTAHTKLDQILSVKKVDKMRINTTISDIHFFFTFSIFFFLQIKKILQ